MTDQDTPSFDAAVGADASSLNATIAAFYQAVPGLFTKTFNIGALGVSTIVLQFTQAPTLAMTAPDKYHAEARDVLASRGPQFVTPAAIRALTTGLMMATMPMSVTINAAIPVTVAVVVSSGAGVTIQPSTTQPGQQVLSLALADATITVANDPGGIFTQLLTNVFLPPLLAYLNQSILGNIQIPMLSLLGVTFASPVVVDETSGGDNFLVAYTGLDPVVPPAAGTAWPSGTIFVAVDANALDAVANQKLPAPSGSGGIDDPNLSWDYNVTLRATVLLNPGAGNSVSVQIGVNGSANFTWHMPNWIPNISFDGSISGTAVATAALVATADGANQDIAVVIQDASDFDLSLDIDGLPGPLSTLLGPITDAILDAVAPLIASALSNYPITVYTLKPISLSFPGLSTYQLVLQDIELSQIAGPTGLSMAAVTAVASFTPAPSVTLRKSQSATQRRPIGRVKSVVAH